MNSLYPFIELDPKLALPGLLRATISDRTILQIGAPDRNMLNRLRAVGFEARGLGSSENAGWEEALLLPAGFTDDPGRRFDLVLSLDGLGGQPETRLEAMIADICSRTGRFLLSFDQFSPAGETNEPRIPAIENLLDMLAGHQFYLDLEIDPVGLAPMMFLFTRQTVLWTETAREYEIRVITYAYKLRQYRKTVNQQQKDWDSLHDTYFLKFLQYYSRFEQKLFPDSKPFTEFAGRTASSLMAAYRRLRASAGGTYRRIKRFSITGLLGLGAGAYERWMMDYEPDKETLGSQAESAAAFSHLPLVSFITPVYNPPAQVIADTIRSVQAQTYPQWELCLADASTDPGIGPLLADFAARDSRIQVKRLDENLGISGNSNLALEMASGEFIAILDHDDVLAPNMLYEVVRRINEKPQTDVVYFDEDKLSAGGDRRMDPFYKPDWSPELLISANYLTHAVYRRSLVDEIGFFDPKMDGAQDWDLALRASEHTGRIEHIAQILYHWRQVQGSTAGVFEAKDWVFENQKSAVRSHLGRRGIEAQVSLNEMGRVRADWAHRGGKVSIVIPTKDKVEFLRRTVDSIRQRTAYPDYEIIIVDNRSGEPETHDYYAGLDSDNRILFVNFQEEFNYSRANNLGAHIASGEYLLFLNNDIEVLEPDWLDEMVRWAELPEIGAVGPKLLFPDGTIQHAGVILGMEGHASHVFYGGHENCGGIFGSVDWYRDYLAVTGACMLMPRPVFDQVGGFDEHYELVFSDIEICLRIIRQGLRVVYTPYARLRHFEGKSRGAWIPVHDIRRGVGHFLPFVEKGDPYFNPNLSHTLRMPSFRTPQEADPVERLRKME